MKKVSKRRDLMNIMVLLLFIEGLLAQPTVQEVIQKFESQPKPKDIVSTITMTLTKSVRGKEKSRIRTIKRFQKFYRSGDFYSKTLIRFLEPSDVKGVGLLILEYHDGEKGSDQWLYLPALKKSKRIVSNQKNQNFMGSDFSYEDMKGLEISENSYKLLGEEKVIGQLCYKIETVPFRTVNYSRQIVWVDKDRSLMRKVEFYDNKNRLLKVMTVPEIRKDGDYWTVLRMEMENIQKPHRTTLEISDIVYDSGIEENFFSEDYLKRIR